MPEQLLLPSGNELPPEFPFASMVELGESVAFELRLPFRQLPVSQDASAALHSLEHLARCKARLIGDQPIGLPDFDTLDSSTSCSFLSFPHREPAHALGNVSSQMNNVLATTNQSAHSIVQCSSTFVTSDHSTPVEPGVLSDLTLLPRLGPRAPRLTHGYTFALRCSQRAPCRPAPFQLSLRQFSLHRAAILLRN